MEKSKRVPGSRQSSKYYGFLFCEACKQTMKVRHRQKKNTMRVSYSCSLATKKKGVCGFHGVDEEIVNEAVLRQINRLIVLAQTDKQAFHEMLRSQSAEHSLAELEAVTAELESIRTRISEIDRFVQGLFESGVKGEVDGDMFCTFSENYRSEKAELNVNPEVLAKKEERLKKEANKSVKSGTSVHKYDTISEVTPEVLRDFIDRIGAGDFTGTRRGKKKVRKISVFFIGIGEFFPY